MKKFIVIALSLTVLTSCVSKREIISTTDSNFKYKVKEEASSTVTSNKLWILFIPIGPGPRKYSDRKEKVTQKFLKQNEADAIQSGTIVDRKVIIPLILINWSTHWTKLEGRPCVLNNQ